MIDYQLIILFIFNTSFQVQSKVSLKYDSWHKDVLGKFGSLLGNEMAVFHTTISKVSLLFSPPFTVL